MITTSGSQSRLSHVLEEYLAACQAGHAPNKEEFLARHPDLAGDLEACLASLEFIRQAGVSEHLPQALSPAVESNGAGEHAEGASRVLGDYRIVREVGRGGMGVVYEAEQISLARRVALKVLPYAAVLDARALQRFKNEAQAAAALDHPNIVDLHGIGCERGVHFYAMRFVDGPSLAEVIEARRAERIGLRAGEVAGKEPGNQQSEIKNQKYLAATTAFTSGHMANSTDRSRTVDFSGPPLSALCPQRPNLAFYRIVAEIGAHVAEALDHAHQTGVIHRDVKPSNILIQHSPLPAGERNAREGNGKHLPPRPYLADFGLARIDAGNAMTATGDLLGTLRYMSPEQALANRVLVDHRTDIYSLGATLYELLTLAPVFEGADRQHLLRQISFDEPRALRKIDPSIPSELETIVLKSLEKNPTHRYATAQDLADDLRRFVEDRPIRARRPGMVQRVSKWSRRHKPAVGTAVFCVLAVALSAAGALGWAVRERAVRRATIEGEARSTLREALRLVDAQKFPEATIIAEQAKGLLEGGSDDAKLTAETNLALRDLTLVNHLENASLLRWQLDPDGTRLQPESALPEYDAAFREYGILPLQTSAPKAANTILKRPIAVQRVIIAALDDWIEVERDIMRLQWLLGLVALADPNPLRNSIQKAFQRRQWEKLINLTRDDHAVSQMPPALRRLGVILCQNNKTRQTGLALLRRAQQQSPGDFWINRQLYQQLMEDGRAPEEALRFATAVVAVRPENPAALAILALALRECGRHEEAIPVLLRVIELRPRWAGAHLNLGNCLADRKQFDKAILEFRRAIALKPDYALAHSNLGHDLGEKGQLDEAIAEYRRAIELKPDFANAHSGLGKLLRDKGQLDEAIREFQRAIALTPDNAEAHNSLGVALSKKGRVDEAIGEYRCAIALKPDCAEAHYNLGADLRDKGDLDEAIAEYHRAIELNPDFANSHSDLGKLLRDKGQLDEAIREFQRAIALTPDDADAHNNLGVALSDKGQLDEAILEFRQAIEIKPDRAETHSNLGVALSEKGRVDEAIGEYRCAIALKPDCAGAHYNLGADLRDKGHLDEAIAEYRRAIELKPDFANAHFDLGKLLRDKGHLDEAIREFQRAIALTPDDAEAHNILGVALRDRGPLDEAVGEFQRAIAIQPDLAEAHDNLGVGLSERGQLDEAILEYRQAIEIKPDSAVAHSNLGVALTDKGQLDEAILEYRQALEIKPDRAETHYNLGNALLQKGQLDEATGEYRRAIALKPNYAKAHFNLGCALQEKHQWDEAVIEYRGAIELKPDDAEAHSNLGTALFENGHLDEAIAECGRAIELKPDFAEAHSNLGKALFENGQLGEAIAEFRRGIELDPDWPQAHFNLGVALRGMGQWDEAVVEHRRAIELKPDFAEAHSGLGAALSDRGRLDEAIAEYRKAVTIKPGYAEAYNNLAWLLATRLDPKSPNPAESIQWANRAVEQAAFTGHYWNTLGVAQFRGGSYGAAVEALLRSLSLLNHESYSYNAFFLAMGHWQLGNKDMARDWYDMGVEWMEKNAPQDEELRRFRAEAAALLRINVEAKPAAEASGQEPSKHGERQ